MTYGIYNLIPAHTLIDQNVTIFRSLHGLRVILPIDNYSFLFWRSA